MNWNAILYFYIETLLTHQGAFINSLLRVNIDCARELLICLLNLSQITTFLHTRGNSVYVYRFFYFELVAAFLLIGNKKVLNHDKVPIVHIHYEI